jgi:hypothetical protein
MITCPFCERQIETDLIDKERLEGIGEIRKFIDPMMSERTFYRKHRQGIEHLLIKREKVARFGGKPRKPSFFTWKRLVIAYLLEREQI